VELIDLGGVAEAAGDHGVEGGEIFFVALGEAAEELGEREEAGTADFDGGHDGDFAGILGHFPCAGVAAADDLAEVAAPEADFEFEVELGTFTDEGDDFIEGFDGIGGKVKLQLVLETGALRGGTGVAVHHGPEVGEGRGFQTGSYLLDCTHGIESIGSLAGGVYAQSELESRNNKKTSYGGMAH
jgi:hypothetical protein